jgi:hypothetical protein
MKQEDFDKVFTSKFQGFTGRLWLDYVDETKTPFAETKDYAGYVIENLKYLVKRFNKENT